MTDSFVRPEGQIMFASSFQLTAAPLGLHMYFLNQDKAIKLQSLGKIDISLNEVTYVI